ncbi:MAG: type II and III secretion system protein family protein [Alphaproteobacteria bacterium]|nr:type II and III secretion system protein family protein [Alphaproteobacteria bacterium]
MRRITFWIALAVMACSGVALPARAAALNEDDGRHTIKVEINKGRMVRLSRIASSVVVADPSIADIQVVSPRMVYVHAKKIGETSFYAMDANDAPIIDETIEVTHNLTKLTRAIKDVAPESDISFKSVDGGLVINGYTDSAQESEHIKTLASAFLGDKEKLVNLVNTAGSDQVTLMVKVAEVSRDELKRFGINIASIITSGNFAFNILQGRSFLDATGNIVRSTSAAGIDNSIFAGYRGQDFNSIIDALETQGLVSVLAEPNLTTASGKTANFLAGGEFPIPIVDSTGSVNVEYKSYGISLNFTPVVMSRDKISLNVSPEVSTISSLNALTLGNNTSQFVIPSLQTRRAQTTVELGSGQTFAIAGLLSNDRTNNINKFPGLGDIPVLGSLFRSHQFQNNQSELVILVTPYIVRPVSDRAKIKSPLDGYVPPTDLQRLLLGQLYDSQARDEEGSAASARVDLTPDAPALHGEGGFILE